MKGSGAPTDISQSDGSDEDETGGGGVAADAKSDGVRDDDMGGQQCRQDCSPGEEGRRRGGR